MAKKLLVASFLLLIPWLSVNAQNQAVQVFNSRGIKIGPGKYFYVNFHVDVYLKRARLAGNVMARGGGGNDIVLQVVKDGRIIYDSGQQRSIVLSIPLNEPGQYSLILTNSFSVLSSKVVWGYVNLYSDGPDAERTSDEMRRQRNRESVSAEILTRLYTVLQQNERQWYTRQVPFRPQITVTRDSDLNAFADVANNRILVTRGLFEAAEYVAANISPAAGTALLAGVIGHELAHIFFRHPGNRSRGLWGELIGALPIDRNQERQADSLGAYLACEAGYGPEGLAQFMRMLISRYGNKGNLGSTHPSSRERVAMIEQVSRQCPAAGR